MVTRESRDACVAAGLYLNIVSVENPTGFFNLIGGVSMLMASGMARKTMCFSVTAKSWIMQI